MNLELDYYAHENALANISSNFKIIIVSILLILVLAADLPLLSFFIAIFIFLFIPLVAKIPIKFFIKFLAIPITFIIFTSIFLLFFFGTGYIIFPTGIFGIAITTDSLNLAILVFSRTLACFLILSLLALTTPIAEVFMFLSKLKVPSVFIEIAILMYNSIFIFISEFKLMCHAQKTRLGFSGFKNTYRSFGLIFSNLFIKSINKSDRLDIALNSRCYTGNIYIYNPNTKYDND
ncbi:MAG: cobalt ECF transporter T component CbiQ [Methanobacteriaceae archaeon]